MRRRRKRRPKPQEMVWIILAITAVCVVLVFAIIMTQKKQRLIDRQAQAVGTDMVYENAYIVSNESNRLIFICDGQLYRAKGTMEEQYTGVADIKIHDSKIEKVAFCSTLIIFELHFTETQEMLNSDPFYNLFTI